MPFAKLTLTPQPLQDTAHRLAADLTDLVARDLAKRHELTSVLIETPGATYWSIGAEHQTTAAHLEVCVTTGTNSQQEKRIFVANAMALLKSALPALNTATYVVVREIPATDWGYDGLSQADRAGQKAQSAHS